MWIGLIMGIVQCMQNYIANVGIGFKVGPCAVCQQLVPLVPSTQFAEMAQITSGAEPDLYNRYHNTDGSDPVEWETIQHSFHGQKCEGSGGEPQALCPD